MRRHPLTVREHEEAAPAARRLIRRGLRCVPVTRKGRVIGVITLDDLEAGEGPVRQRLRPACCLDPDETVVGVLARDPDPCPCLPVTTDGRLVGVTSADDLRAVMAAEAVEWSME